MHKKVKYLYVSDVTSRKVKKQKFIFVKFMWKHSLPVLSTRFAEVFRDCTNSGNSYCLSRYRSPRSCCSGTVCSAQLWRIISEGKAYLTRRIFLVIYIVFPGGLLDKTKLLSSLSCSKRCFLLQRERQAKNNNHHSEYWVNRSCKNAKKNVFTEGKCCLASRLETILHFHVFGPTVIVG